MSLELDKSAWKRVKLGEVVAASKEKVDPSDGSVDRFIAGEHMDTDDLKIHRWGDPSEVDLGPAFHRRFRPGQVLYGSRRTYLRKVAVADFDGVCANTTFVVESKDPGVLLQEFLPFVMTSEPFHAFAIAESKGSVNPYVNWSDIARYEFNLPPLEEQKRIADLLWAVERHRLALEKQALELRATLARWALQQFDAAVGSERRIVDLCEFVIGGVWGAPAGEGEVDVLALGPKSYSGDVVFVDPNGSPTRSITRKQAAGRILREGDIVLERSGGSFEQAVGRVMIAGPDLPDTIPTDFQRLLRPDRDQVEPAYLFWKLRLDWLTGVTRDYARRTTNISNLAVPDYLARTLVVPPKHDQLALIERVGQLNGAVDQAVDEVEALAALHGSFLADVFGGN
ncbi:restriction endonuclease subunit S [Nocardiopsis composta]|uniref:Type I restriction enzyme S subunit n=1 Tax=Nocardiopsis composta TaxID=157465 RepID=A0A7W8VDS0_9ACTN|nr:restriction endonuclease subunit S [Nocardiopsis composta]MBB5432308.1 type I restriction enzyme S subunit [Nocardiopsis composta]